MVVDAAYRHGKARFLIGQEPGFAGPSVARSGSLPLAASTRYLSAYARMMDCSVRLPSSSQTAIRSDT